MYRHAEQMRKMPFDGTVTPGGMVKHPTSQKEIDLPKRLTVPSKFAPHWRFDKSPKSDKQPTDDDSQRMKQIIYHLKTASNSGLPSNFFRVFNPPLESNWAHWLTPEQNASREVIIHNMKIAAYIARWGNCEGILFDTEAYGDAPKEIHPHGGEHIYNWSRQKDQQYANNKVQDYMDCVKEWGNILMSEALLPMFEEMPHEKENGTVLFTMTYYTALTEFEQERKKNGEKFEYHHSKYGLLPSFINGMVDGCRESWHIPQNTKPSINLVHGFERAYPFRWPTQFNDAVDLMRNRMAQATVCLPDERNENENGDIKIAKPLITDPEKHARVFQVAFGLHLTKEGDWDASRPYDPRQYHHPKRFGSCVQRALELADEYVWIFTNRERMEWWTEPDGLPSKVNQAFINKIWDARRAVGLHL